MTQVKRAREKLFIDRVVDSSRTVQCIRLNIYVSYKHVCVACLLMQKMPIGRECDPNSILFREPNCVEERHKVRQRYREL